MEKKLSTEQVEYVFNYVASKDIKWYELQVELTDHIVSRMEEFWAKDPELTFHQVKYYAEQEFGRNGFKAIEKERTLILQKTHKREQWKMIGEYFKFPKIIVSIFAVFLVYKGSFYFENIAHYTIILSGILLGFSVLAIINWYRFKKINGKRFLALETAYKMNNNAILLSYSLIMLSKNFAEHLDTNHYKFIIVSCLWVLGILMIITGRHLTNQVVSNIKKQYQLT